MVRSRWAQLTYASFDTGTGSGGGGWQVKETSGDPDESEIELLQSRIVTSFDSVISMPQFPTPEEILALPRRLSYLTLGNHSAAYWHSVPSGTDGTGRPGNVFSHVKLDRAINEPSPPIRPIDSWKSGWLAPFGQQQVLAAVLSAAEPVAGTTVNRDRIIDFLLDETVWRGGVLAVLLDATSAALRGGKKIVLVADDADTAALWIGSVSHLMGPQTARTLGFSLVERASAVGSIAERGSIITAVPIEDRAMLAKLDGFVVIATDESPSLGDFGGEAHTTSGGERIAVTAWSALAQVALQERATAGAVLRTIDEISQVLAPEVLAPEWPLAMAVAVLGGDLADADDEASKVISDSSPDGLADHPDLWNAAARLVGTTLGTTAADVWATLAPTAGILDESLAGNFAASLYVERAVTDRSWLAQSGTIPLPDLGTLTVGSRQRLTAVANAAVAVLEAEFVGEGISTPLARDAVRLGDFLARSGLIPAHSHESVGVPALEILLERLVVPVIVADPEQRFAEYVGPISPRFATGWIRPLIDTTFEIQARPVGSKVPDSLLLWMFPDRFESFADSSGLLNSLEVETVVRASVGGMAEARPFRTAAVSSLLDRNECDPQSMSVAALFRPEWPWTVSEVVAVESRVVGTVPSEIVVAVMLAAEPSDELDTLRQIVRGSLDSGARAGDIAYVVALRDCEFALRTGVPLTVTLALQVVEAVRWLGRVPATTPLSSSIGPACVASVVLAGVLTGPTFSLEYETIRTLGEFARHPADKTLEDSIVENIASEGVLLQSHIVYLAELAVRSEQGTPVPLTMLTETAVATQTLRAGNDRLVVRLLEAVMSNGALALETLDELVYRSVESRARASSNEKQADRALGDFDRFARGYWKKLRAATKSKSRRTLGGAFSASASQKTEES